MSSRATGIVRCGLFYIRGALLFSVYRVNARVADIIGRYDILVYVKMVLGISFEAFTRIYVSYSRLLDLSLPVATISLYFGRSMPKLA